MDALQLLRKQIADRTKAASNQSPPSSSSLISSGANAPTNITSVTQSPITSDMPQVPAKPFTESAQISQIVVEDNRDSLANMSLRSEEVY